MNKIFSQTFTLLIHIALAIIVAGAFVTHFCGIQGTLNLHEGERAVGSFTKTSGPGDGRLPFGIALERAETICYPGTSAPMDFRSLLRIDGRRVSVSMNAVAEIDSWRFYQSGMGAGSTTLSVSHDPWGIGITYTGYILLGVGMAGFFFQRKSLWRAALRNARRNAAATMLLLCCAGASAVPRTELPTMQRPLAKNFGKVFVYWNDRVSPLRTMALDVTEKLYGSTSYRGMTAEQVLAGWLFYYDAWLADYNSKHPAGEGMSEKQRRKEEERRNLIQWVGSGSAFRIYPYHTAGGEMEWLSLTERRPSKMSTEQWIFMTRSMTDINELLLQGRNVAANEAIGCLIEGQRRYAGADALPSDRRFSAELFYADFVHLLPAGLILLVAGGWSVLSGRRRRWGFGTVAMLGVVYLGVVLALRGWIGGHWPLSNGPETMLFMGFTAAAGAALCREGVIGGALLTISGMATLVAAMGSKTPQIGSLMPVLASPLLSVHVMLVMCSYVLLMLMAVLAGISLWRGGETLKRLARINAVILIPALFLLTAGIFVGAVWANQSWGRYWGWDPKETCALITMLVYALPAHRGSIHWLRSPGRLQWYLLIAIITVIFTYFGANYLLPGLHSYA